MTNCRSVSICGVHILVDI